jgi:hypothetical protein
VAIIKRKEPDMRADTKGGEDLATRVRRVTREVLREKGYTVDGEGNSLLDDAPDREPRQQTIKRSGALAELNGHKEEQQRRQKVHTDPFMTHVARIQKRDSCTRSQAMMQAAEEQPEALAEYRSQHVPADPRAELIRKGRQRQANIDARIREVQKRDNCSRSAALQTLHDESPELWEDHVEA